MHRLIPAILLLASCNALAASYLLPAVEDSVVGQVRTVRARHQDTLLDIARQHDIGQEEILRANPDVDRWLPGADTEVVLPTRYVLPVSPPVGVVLNLAEMRLYYYPKPAHGESVRVETYPVGIGRMDWHTPLGTTRIIAKDKDPSWRPPASVRAEHARDGDPLPTVIPPGPDNPLGKYALRLGITGYLIHGTNRPYGVGMQVSHGCVRMLPEDIERLFPQVSVGTAVRIVNQPVKAGWLEGRLYLEVHPPLEEGGDSDQPGLEQAASGAINAASFGRLVEIDYDAVRRAIDAKSGIPVVISQGP